MVAEGMEQVKPTNRKIRHRVTFVYLEGEGTIRQGEYGKQTTLNGRPTLQKNVRDWVGDGNYLITNKE